MYCLQVPVSRRRRRVVFVLEIPLRDSDRYRFGVEDLRSHGFDVEFWDLSRLYHRGARAIPFESLREATSRKVATLKEFNDAVQSLDHGDTVVLVGGVAEGLVSRHRRVLRSLRGSRAMISALAFGAVPMSDQLRVRGGLALKLMRRIQAVVQRPEVLAEWFFRAWERAIISGLLPRPTALKKLFLDVIYVGVDETEVSPLLRSAQTRVLLIHELDYELASQMDNCRNADDSHFVFLGFGGQDAQILRIKQRVPMERRAEVVNGVLTEIEEFTGLRAVIAAHPRSRPGRFESCFQEKNLIYGQTPELISRSRGVVSANDSTAISYAVLYRKPLVMLYLPELGEAHKATCHAYEEMLGARVIDTSLQMSEFSWPAVSEIKYQNYSERYLKRPDSIHGRFWTIVASDIRRNG